MAAKNLRTSQLTEVGLLADPVRRRLYEFVAARADPATRDDAARSTGIARSLAAYHLDKLADAGLLDASYAREPGRGGPGSGRPAKRYARSRREVAVSLPPRSYGLLAHIVVAAADSADNPEFRAALMASARREGRALSAQAPDLATVLEDVGYEPATRDDGDVVMRNCPFHSVAQAHTELACGLNQAFIEGALSGTGCDPGRAELYPAEGRCCVVIHRCDDCEGSPSANASGGSKHPNADEEAAS